MIVFRDWVLLTRPATHMLSLIFKTNLSYADSWAQAWQNDEPRGSVNVVSIRIPTKELAYLVRNYLLITESVEVSLPAEPAVQAGFCLDLFCNFFGSSQKSCKNRKYNLIKKIEFNEYIANVDKNLFVKTILELHQ